MTNFGKQMITWMKDLFPLCRSLTGDGVDKTLDYLKKKANIEFKIVKFKTGQKVFDWKIPKVWNIKDGYVKTISGEKIINFKNNNLHVLGYSTSINKIVLKEELLKHIHTQPNQPEWIPYVTSYYKKNWGFCVSENFKKKLKNKKYKVHINSTHKNGELKIAESLIKGKKIKKYFFLLIFATHLWQMIILQL